MNNKYDQTIERLEAAGWIYSHTATVRNYRYSGTVSNMQSRGGYEFCRVHIGKSYNVKSGGYWYTLQLTRVFRRCIK